MALAAIFIPNFAVQAVIRGEPALAGAAVALVDGTPPATNVVAANEAALRAGIELGMARAFAEQLTTAEQFKTVQIRPRSRAQEKSAHAALLDLAWSISPRVEDTATDRSPSRRLGRPHTRLGGPVSSLLIDLAGLSTAFGSDENIAAELARGVSALRMTAQIAVAANPETALHAARGFPGITLIAPGEEAQRLGCLAISVLEPTAQTLETLELWGVHTLAALAALPVLQLSERLGQEGVRLHEWARGAGARALVPAEPSMRFEEEMELEDAAEELEPLAFLLGRLLDQLCARLAARSLAIAVIQLRFSLDPAGEKDIQVRNDHSRRKKKSDTYERTLTLPAPMRNSKMLLNLIRLKLQGDPPKSPILKLFMAAEAAKPRAMQNGLFVPASPDPEKLELTMARLANLVGEANIGSPQLADTHRPDAFRMDSYAPAREGSKTMQRGGKSAGAKQPAPGEKTMIGFRMFRPPLQADVQLREDRPQSVWMRGARGEVVAASGPWRISGDWWRDGVWDQDEWDLEIRFDVAQERGLYRFYFDALQKKWFVRGSYD
jgi:protein ImuB